MYRATHSILIISSLSVHNLPLSMKKRLSSSDSNPHHTEHLSICPASLRFALPQLIRRTTPQHLSRYQSHGGRGSLRVPLGPDRRLSPLFATVTADFRCGDRPLWDGHDAYETCVLQPQGQIHLFSASHMATHFSAAAWTPCCLPYDRWTACVLMR